MERLIILHLSMLSLVLPQLKLEARHSARDGDLWLVTDIIFSRRPFIASSLPPRPCVCVCLPPPVPALPVGTRRAPSGNCRDARVYVHTTTAMHDMGKPLFLLFLLAS